MARTLQGPWADRVKASNDPVAPEGPEDLEDPSVGLEARSDLVHLVVLSAARAWEASAVPALSEGPLGQGVPATSEVVRTPHRHRQVSPLRRVLLWS